MQNPLTNNGIILQSGEISKDKINLIAGAMTLPFAEMVWIVTNGDMETMNRLTEIITSMNTPADRGKVIGEMGLSFLAYNLRRAITLVGVDKLIEAAREGATRGISLLFANIAPRKPELSEIKGFC